MFHVVFKLVCVGFCWFVFDFNKIVIGKSTFLGYNDKKIFLHFFRFRVKLQHNLTFLVIYIQITQNGGYFMSTASIHSFSPWEDSTILIDLHTHSLSSGHGSNDTITDMAKAAAKSGIQILGISEHGPATAGSVKPSYFRSLKDILKKDCYLEVYKEEEQIRLYTSINVEYNVSYGTETQTLYINEINL